MPTSAAVHDQLTRIIVEVVGCEPEAVVQSARLKRDLGVDSLSIVEVTEKLGLAFGVYIPDEAIDSMQTVQDAINSVVHHDPKVTGPAHPASTIAAARFTPEARAAQQLPDEEIERRKQIAWRFAWGFAAVGLVLGLVFGVGGAALVNASGLKDVQAPAGPTPTETTTTTAPTDTPSPTDTTTPDVPKPSLSAANSEIAPGDKLRLTGAFPELGKGATLQVQVKDAGTGWDDFPVTTKTKDDGKFETVIFTTRTGERKFRLTNEETGTSTPEVTVTIG